MMNHRIPEAEGMFDESAVKNYESFCRQYLERGGYTYLTKSLEAGEINNGLVLDLGSGSGALAVKLARTKKNLKIIGVDLSSAMVEMALERSAGLDNLSFCEADVHSLPFQGDYFDVVVSFASLHHWRSPYQVFGEACRVLKTSGKIIIFDLKRDLKILNYFVSLKANPAYALLESSVRASYTCHEIHDLLDMREETRNWQVKEKPFGMIIVGEMHKNHEK